MPCSLTSWSYAGGTSLGFDKDKDKDRERYVNIDKKDCEFESIPLKTFYKNMLPFFVFFLSGQFPQWSVKAKTEKTSSLHWFLLEIAFPLRHAVKV